jgi:hypothetical protein
MGQVHAQKRTCTSPYGPWLINQTKVCLQYGAWTFLHGVDIVATDGQYGSAELSAFWTSWHQSAKERKVDEEFTA